MTGSSYGLPALTLLGTVAIALMFLTLTAAAVNVLEDAEFDQHLVKANNQQRSVDSLLVEIGVLADRLSEQREQLARVEEARQSAERRRGESLAQEEALRDRIHAAETRGAKLTEELRQARRVSAERIYGATQANGVVVRFVECLPDGVVLQPEGRRLAAGELDGLNRMVGKGQIAFLVRPGSFEIFKAARTVVQKERERKIGFLPVPSQWNLDFSKMDQ